VPHDHHGITCTLPTESAWCAAIEQVLAQIQRTRPDDYDFLCGRVTLFEVAHDSDRKVIQQVRAGEKDVYAATAGFVLPPRAQPPPRDFVEKGYIELSVLLTPADEQRRLCTVAQELAHARDILGALTSTGDVPRRKTWREDEEEADRIVAAWGFRCVQREEMKPGGWYDRQDQPK
jgi:hypothetical protein